jgi:glycosyltransferase involved in cell wall biosynthesis
MIPDADLDRLPSAIADKYRADPARWEAAALSTLAQRAGVPRLASLPAGALVIRSQQLASWTGYGQLAIEFARAMVARGVDVRFCPDTVAEIFLPLPEFASARRVPRIPPGQPTLAVGTPFWGGGFSGVQLTMWETTALPGSFVANLNQRSGLIVPSDAVRDVFQSSGVTVPIEVVPLGIDPETFYPAPMPAGPFTVLSGGRVSHGGIRKGHGFLARCFQLAFPGRDDVRLVLKVWPDCPSEAAWDVPSDPRIVVDDRILSDDDLATWYLSGHVYATASKGEGWGLMTHQAMACGRPVIGCAFGSAGVLISNRTGWSVPYRLEPAASGWPYDGTGQWACPDMAGMVRALRQAEANRHDLEQRWKAATLVAHALTWDHAATLLGEALTRLGVLRPSVAEVQAIQARQRRCPSLTRGGCNCYCSRLERRPDVWTDCRPCPELPSVLATPAELASPRRQDPTEADDTPQAENDRGQRPEKQGRQQRQKEKPPVRRS